jgi:propionate CoA-transferase
VPTVINLREAAGLIRDGDAVLVGGSGGGHAVPEAFIEALAARFRATGGPRDLTLVSVVSIGDWESTGFNRLAFPGLLRRVISAGLNNCPQIAELARADRIEAYTLPQGVLSQLCRDMAAGRPGLLTRTGLHTFVDPRHGGGKQSSRTKEDVVEVVQLRGQEYLLYQALPVDVAVIRGHDRRRARQRHDGGGGVLRRAALRGLGGAQPRGDRHLPRQAACRRREPEREARQGAGDPRRLPGRRARRARPI